MKNINFTEPKLKDFKCFKLPIDELPNHKEVLILGNVYNFFGTYKDEDSTLMPWAGEGATSNFMNFGQFVMNRGHATIIASKETCNYYRKLYKEFYDGFGTTHPKVVLFEIDDTKFLKGNFKIKDGKEEKLVKGEYFWAQGKDGKWEFNYPDFLKSFFENGEKRMFDMIIANPPYGKSASISTVITSFLLQFSKAACFLEPLKSNIPTWGKIKEVKGPFSLSEYFENIPEANDLDVYITTYPGNGTFTQTYEKIQMTKKQLEWFEAVERYNKDHKNSITFLQMLTSKKKEPFSKYEENQIFEIPIYTPFAGVQLGGQSGEHNLQEKPIRWYEGSSAPWGLYFKTRKAFENFRDWYYKVPYSFSRRKRDNINCLWDLMLSILLNIWGSDPSILKYDLVLPHLNWDEDWSDEKILKELGLPENFLEKKE